MEIATHLITGQVVQQLLEVVAVVFLELQSGPLDTLLKAGRLVGLQKFQDGLQGLVLLTGRLQGVDVVGLTEVQVDVAGGIDEQSIELLASPLEEMSSVNYLTPWW